MNHLFEAYQPDALVQANRIINTPSDFAKKALFYVQETGYLKSFKSQQSKQGNLSSCLFMIVISGRGTFTYQNRTYLLIPNDCVLIDCMEQYAYQSDESSPWELLWVHYYGRSVNEYYQYFIQNYDNVFHPEYPEEYIQLIRSLIEVHQHKESSWELVASKLITDLLTNCVTMRPTNSHLMGESILEKIYSVKDYIDQNYAKKILIDNLAYTFYISKYHLCREYKKIFGTTIVDYITMKRITHAKELLRFTNHSIEEIAVDIGYPNASYFNKVFQKVESMTGSEYRKKW